MRPLLKILSFVVILIIVLFSFIRDGTHSKDDKSVWGQGTPEELSKQTKFKLDGLAAGIRVYSKIHGKIPTNGVDLIQDFKRGKVSLDRCAETMFDSWGHQITYSVQNSNAVLTSAGADGEISTGDDIVLQVGIAEGTHVIWSYMKEMTLEKSQRVFSP